MTRNRAEKLAVRKTAISRRRFLGRAACVFGAACAGADAAPRVRIGLIGCGRRGRVLLEELMRLRAQGGVEIAAVCDLLPPHRQYAGGRSGAPQLACWRDLIGRNDLDAVCIATPDYLHAPMTTHALEAGRHVYCEAPMARNTDEARRMAEAEARSGCVLAIGAASASEGRYHAARGILAAGHTGPVRHGQAVLPLHTARKTEVRDLPARIPASCPGAAGPDSMPLDPDRFVNWEKYLELSAGPAGREVYLRLAALFTMLPPRTPEKAATAGAVLIRDGRNTPDSLLSTLTFTAGEGRDAFTMAFTSAGAGTPGGMILRGEKSAIDFSGAYPRLIPEKPGPRERGWIIPAGRRPGPLEQWIRCVSGTEGQPVFSTEAALCAQSCLDLIIAPWRERMRDAAT
jgi:hypothetical protein